MEKDRMKEKEELTCLKSVLLERVEVGKMGRNELLC